MLRHRLVTRPPWPWRFPAAAAVLVPAVAAVVVVAVAAVVGVAAVVVVAATAKTSQWYLDPAPLAGSDL